MKTDRRKRRETIVPSIYTRNLKIVSGGQTGVDRAGLDFAIENNLEHGGWCPSGRVAEDGPIHRKYNLKETESSNYPPRTRRNIKDSDATLIVAHALPLTRGTLLTKRIAEKQFKPTLVVVKTEPIQDAAMRLAQFIDEEAVETLNVAGPRGSNGHDIIAYTKDLLQSAIRPQNRTHWSGGTPPEDAP